MTGHRGDDDMTEAVHQMSREIAEPRPLYPTDPSVPMAGDSGRD